MTKNRKKEIDRSIFRMCAGFKRDVNISSEVSLIRVDQYWPENCFC